MAEKVMGILDTPSNRNETNTELETEVSIDIKDFNAWYGQNHALIDVNMKIPKNRVMAFIGPSGCGKSTLLRSLNRMNDTISIFRMNGSIKLDGVEITDKEIDPLELRRKVGMVFQDPNPFPMSVYQNMKLPIVENFNKISNREIEDIIITKLKDVGLYDEIRDRINRSALSISGGQQQRLCIARALTINPEVILFDEPCSALDPISTMKIEELIVELSKKYTVAIVTHNMEQARRIGDNVAFFYQGKVVEEGTANKIFSNPETELLENYLSGKF